MRSLRRLILPLCLLLFFMMGGAYGLFYYQNEDPDDVSINQGIQLLAFHYPPEQVIPGGGGNGSVPLGENHLELVTNIVEHTNYGLNADKKPIIHNVLSSDGKIIYCDQTVQGGNLKHLAIDSSDNADRLYFVILRKSDSEYHTFTMTQNDIGFPIGTRITVYMTVMVKDEKGVWSSSYSFKGTAEVNDPGIVSRAIDVHSFVSDYEH